MGLYLWNDAYSIGIAEIDQQHKDMFTTMNSLHQAMLTGQSGPRIEPVLLALTRSCQLHFRTEEALMAFHRFPDLENHRSEHRLIAAQLEIFLAEHKANKPGMISDLLDYMEDWQGIHILQHDLKYRDYLMQQWGINFKLDPSPLAEPSRTSQEDRRFSRLASSIPVQLRSLMDAPIVFARCVNVSQSGAFLRTWSPLRVNTTATAQFQLGRNSAELRVCVRRSEPCIGMGVSFLSPLPAKLQDLIRELEQNQPRDHATEITCERLLHDCIQNLAALEDVITEADITQNTVAALRALVTRARRLETLTQRCG